MLRTCCCVLDINPQIVSSRMPKNLIKTFPNGLFRNVYEYQIITMESIDIVNQQNVSLLSPDGIVKSGIAGLMN